MNFEPNRWQVLTTYIDGAPNGQFYAFRNPPNAAFHVDAAGSRILYSSKDEAQAVVDRLNRESAT